MNAPPSITTVLLDMDGVIRLFDPDHPGRVEQAHGLRRGLLTEAAFASALLTPVVTGLITREQWIEQIGDVVSNPAAAREWLDADGEIDWNVVALADELRASGTTVAVLTNGTDSTAAEAERLGLVDHFDAIFCTADIGFAKPDRRAFAYVCDALAVDPRSVFFADDSESKLAGAIELGMIARHYTSCAALRVDLAHLGLVQAC